MALVSKTFSQIITFTRASTATFFNSAGTLTSAAVDAPRFDYDPSTLAAQGLLIEESRTNLLLQSADFTTTWGQTNVTITANTTASPDGGTNGDTLLINSAGAATNQTSQTFTAGSTITITVFAKKNASNFLRIEAGNLVNCWFNLDIGVTGTNSAGSGNVLFSAKSIQAISGGWYRCVLTVTTSTITTLGVLLFATNTDNNTSSINSSIFLWGAQLEAGAFPTSYIPTTTAALTRAADVASVNTLSPWYNATASTLYAEWTNLAATMPTGAAQVVARIGDATGNNFISLFQFQNASSKASQNMFSGGANPGRLDSGGAYSNATVKAAAAFAASDRALSTNGTAATTSATGAMPLSATRMGIGIDDTFNGPLNGYLRRITYYPRRLSNAELVSITS
jgi:hypothetical protein